MGFDRYDPDQINTRHARLTTSKYGVFEFLTFPGLERVISKAELASGQTMSTGRIAGQEAEGTIYAADREVTTRLERWHRESELGAAGYIQAGLYQRFLASRAIGMVENIAEMWLMTMTSPDQDATGDGAPGIYTVTFNVWVPRRQDVLGAVPS